MTRLGQMRVSLSMFTVPPHRAQSLIFPVDALSPHPTIRVTLKARTSRSVTPYDCDAPPCRRPRSGEKETKGQAQTAKECHRCYNTHGSLRCCSSAQSKKPFLLVIVVVVALSPSIHHSRKQLTPPAALPPPSNLSSAATFTTTNTTHLSLSLFYTALHAIPFACALFKDSPLSLPPPSSFPLHSLPHYHQSDHSHIRNYG
jgi:hypothetical protein